MRKISNLVSLLSVSILLLTLNRKTNITQGLLQPFEFLRWQDFHAMITIPLLITVVYTLLFVQITLRQSKIHNKFAYFLTSFAIGLFLYGVSSGNHEVTNYLHHRFCILDETKICQIISFNDDNFSHLVFYISSVILTVTLLLYESSQPERKALSKTQHWIILVNAILIGFGIFINLAFENLGVDPYAFGLLSFVSIILVWQKRKDLLFYPVIYYCALGYGGGTISSILYKLFI